MSLAGVVNAMEFTLALIDAIKQAQETITR